MKTDPTVFLVDDDDAVRASISRFLTASGLHVRSFASAQELLADRDLDRPGCLLLDLKMPGIDGLELQEALNESASAHPIVFLTGQAEVRPWLDGARHQTAHPGANQLRPTV